MENQTKNHELIKVETPQDWESYHRIRREELFEARGRVGVYTIWIFCQPCQVLNGCG